MLLKTLLKDIAKIDSAFENIDVKGISFDTNSIKKGDLFFCLKGKNTDGHEFLQEAKNKGACAAVVEKKNNKIDIPQIAVECTRKTLCLVCSAFYGSPEKALKLIGVTGTNGKTTTTQILKNIFISAGKKVGVIGTLGYYINNTHFKTNLTTPDPTTLYEILSHFKKESVEFVFMEISAHAIFLHKLYGLKFEVGVLTNITQDHLDFFENMELYSKTKLNFLKSSSVKTLVVNADDESYEHFFETDHFSYAIKNPADSFALDIVLSLGESNYALNILDNVFLVSTRLSGEFNVYNALAACTVALLMGIDVGTVKYALETMEDINGRFNVISSKKGKIVVDFAHTPDGLEKILIAVRKASNLKKIICVFGCNGNRDRLKRPIMGRIAERLADEIILTSDNPRFENADLIIDDILQGVEDKTKFMREPDRKKAIGLGVEMLDDQSVLVICGKGGEKYQDINGVNVPYDDFEVVKSFIEN